LGGVGVRGDRGGAAGGIVGGGELAVVATLALLGLPAWRYATSRDPDERLLLKAAARRALELQDSLQRNLAVHIVNTYTKSQRR
jgi:hypothetical protein